MLRTFLRPAVIALLATPLAFAAAEAQGRATGRAIPPGHMPRAGECRVWYDGRPPGQQPRPTSCREAERLARGSRNARVIYGDSRHDGRWDRRDDRHDGRYDRDRNRGIRSPAPSRLMLPRMPRVSDLRGNRIPSDVQRRIRGNAAYARYEDRNRDGRPERVVFYDRRGRALETWYDLRGDGRADRIVVHRG